MRTTTKSRACYAVGLALLVPYTAMLIGAIAATIAMAGKTNVITNKIHDALSLNPGMMLLTCCLGMAVFGFFATLLTQKACANAKEVSPHTGVMDIAGDEYKKSEGLPKSGFSIPRIIGATLIPGAVLFECCHNVYSGMNKLNDEIKSNSICH